jgi:uncharacterized repeat protein (TIGR03837 family)
LTIDILCKVVDNFGDIGVVYRLAKALTELDAGLELRLLVDDLSAFRALCPSVEVGKAVQTVNGWTVVAWANADDVGRALFRAKRPRKVIECFACGRPDWYEAILFDGEDQESRLIVDLEYLTAEGWAIDFHRLPSATRSAKVRKAIFMPGFVEGTGGLIHGGGFLALREAYLDGKRKPALRGELLRSIASASAGSVGEAEFRPATEAFWVTVFSYERDFRPVIRALAAVGCSRPVLALAAAGKSSGPSLMAWEAADRPFPFVELPFLNQETWDETILASDFSIVRGEDSLSRAALSGSPFLWHAYALQDGAQVAKVRALLDNLKPFFAPADFALIENLYLKFNGPVSVGMESVRQALVEVLDRCGGGPIDLGFRAWSENLLKNGNLAEALLTFIRDFG